MIRLMLIIAFAGFVVCACATGAFIALGGPSHTTFGHDLAWMGDHVSFDDDDDKSSGDDKTITRDLAWTAGDNLEINVPAEVNYTQGPVAKITATGADQLVNDLEVNGDKVEFKDNHHVIHHAHHSLILTITAPSVRKFQLNGAAKLDIANYAQDSLNLEVNGAADVSVAGTAKDLDIELNGAGHGNLRHLVNQNATIQINGAGQATLATTEKADVEINGIGNVRLLNQPKSLTQSRHGFGSVEVGPGDDDDSDDDKPATPAPPAAPAAPAPPVAPAAPVHKHHHANTDAA